MLVGTQRCLGSTVPPLDSPVRDAELAPTKLLNTHHTHRSDAAACVSEVEHRQTPGTPLTDG